jgi:hypothetical protein
MIVGSHGLILAFALLLLPFIVGIAPAFAFSQEVKDAQVLLNSLGFDAGVEDGISGNQTNAALLEFYSWKQKSFDGVLIIQLFSYCKLYVSGSSGSNLK